MDLSLSSDQVLVRNVARDFVKGQAPKEMLVNLDKQGVSFPQDVWNQAAAMGWLGSLIPSDYGGEGNSILDTAIIFEELGRGPVPGPFFESGVLSALTILEGGDESQKRDMLPTIASGQRIFVTAIMDPAPRWGPEGVKMQAVASGGDYVLNGAKAFVHHAAHADSFLVAARTGGADGPITLFVVDKSMAGVDTEDFNNGTMTGFGAVNLNNVKVPGSAVLGQVGQGWNILERALVRGLPVLCA